MTKKIAGRIECLLAILFCCLASISCVSPERSRPNQTSANDDLSIYRITNDQAGHEFVKTEQFLVPVGAVVVIQGLEFEPGISTLTSTQKLIVQHVFNCLEEITENTVGDTNSTRVAQFKKMEFEIRGYPDRAGNREVNAALAEKRAKAVMDLLTYLGTPTWRLKAVAGVAAEGRSPPNAVGENRKKPGRVEFIRKR